MLEDASFHPGRSARNHLRVLALTGQHPPERVEQVLHDVGLTEAADRRVKGYSMGMRQRLAIAAALLGDPEVLLLDEPTNGLDPPGIAWMRGMVRHQAANGRAVLISSHLLAEVAQSVDDVDRHRQRRAARDGHARGGAGRRRRPGDRGHGRGPDALAAALEAAGATVQREGDKLIVPGMAPGQVGAIAGKAQLTVLGLAPRARSLEQAFLALTADRTRMSALLQAELLKLRTTRTFVALVGSALALTLAFGVLSGS